MGRKSYQKWHRWKVRMISHLHCTDTRLKNFTSEEGKKPQALQMTFYSANFAEPFSPRVFSVMISLYLINIAKQLLIQILIPNGPPVFLVQHQLSAQRPLTFPGKVIWKRFGFSIISQHIYFIYYFTLKSAPVLIFMMSNLNTP